MSILLTVLLFLANDFRPAIPSTGRLQVSVQLDTTYSWRFENGEMVVAVKSAPAMFAIEARRKVAGKEVVVGRSGDICRCDGNWQGGSIEVSIWPIEGRKLKASDYPTILVLGAEEARRAELP
jgi:hypothetical protein